MSNNSGKANAEFLHQTVGVVRHLGDSEPRFPQVLFPIDERYPGPGVLAKLLVDHGIQPAQLRVGFLNVDYGRFLVEHLTQGEGFHLTTQENHPALEVEGRIVPERLPDGLPFSREAQVLLTAPPLTPALRQLPAGGQMLFIANQHIEQPETQSYRLQPEQTDIAEAVKKSGLPLKVFDITANKVRYLESSIALLEQAKTAFIAEGQRDFWAARILYDQKMLKRAQRGLTRRFLYHVKKVG